MRTTLDYLIFDYSEDDEDTATWDAMATVQPERWPGLQAEVLQVLAWAEQQFPRQRGALDEGAAWDFDLSLCSASGGDLCATADPAIPALRHAPLPGGQSLTLTLTLTGRPAFAAAFAQAFDLE